MPPRHKAPKPSHRSYHVGVEAMRFWISEVSCRGRVKFVLHLLALLSGTGVDVWSNELQTQVSLLHFASVIAVSGLVGAVWIALFRKYAFQIALHFATSGSL